MHGSIVASRGESTPKRLSDAVITAVADQKGVDECELDRPLYEAIDPDALDTLFRNTVGTVQFEYLGCTVTVEQEGVTVADAADG